MNTYLWYKHRTRVQQENRLEHIELKIDDWLLGINLARGSQDTYQIVRTRDRDGYSLEIQTNHDSFIYINSWHQEGIVVFLNVEKLSEKDPKNLTFLKNLKWKFHEDGISDLLEFGISVLEVEMKYISTLMRFLGNVEPYWN